MKSLATSLEDYLKVRRALGYELKDTERLLNHFLNFLSEKNKKHITIALALEWAIRPKNTTQAYWSRRLSMVAPMVFQDTPTTLNRIIFTVIGWIICKHNF